MKRNLSSNDINETLETEIKQIYINEFNDIFPNILKHTSGKFLSFLCKRIKLTIEAKFNEQISNQIIRKIENYIIEEYYPSQYKIANDNMNLIKNESNSNRKNYIFNGLNFIKHCSNCEFAFHTCGKKFYTNENYIKNLNDLMFICLDCNKIYKNDMIKMNCDKCHDDYYTKYLFNNNNKNKYQFATWSKYHCNILINDKIKCYYCHECLFIDPNFPNLLKCFKCKYTTEVSKLKFKCILCKKEFSSEAKIYNPLEFKIIKISVKDTLINKKKAIPNKDNNYEIEFKCNCKIDFNKNKFYHKKNCRGILLKGKMNKKDIIVCSNCHSLNYYENFIWNCPICDNRTGIIKNKNLSSERRNSQNNNKIEKKRQKSIIYSSAEKNYECYENNNNDIIEKKVCKRINIEYGISRKKSSEGINKIPKPKNRNSSSKNFFYSENKENNPNQVNIKLIQYYNNNNNNNGLNDIMKVVKKQLISQFDDTIPEINKNTKKKRLSFSNNLSPRVKSIEKKENEDNNNISFNNSNCNSNDECNNNVNNSNISFCSNDNIISNDNNIINENNKSNSNNSNNNNNNSNLIISNNNSNNNNKNSLNKNINNQNSNNQISNTQNSNIQNQNNQNLNIKNINIQNQNIKNSKNTENENIQNLNIQNPKITSEIETFINFNVDDFEIKQKIGEGSFGQIFKVKKDSKYYALKKLIGTNEYDFEALQHEYNILRSISSSKNLSIIHIYGMQSKKLDKTTKVLYILMELAESDWEKEIRKKSLYKNYYSENELTSIIKILIKSFSELQKEKISHRDIKPQNILICKNNVFKIADFGEAKELRRRGKVTRIQTIRGTELYMSPLLYSAIKIEKNAIETEHNTYKSDVFSLGLCLLYAACLNFNLLLEIRDIFNMKILEKIVRNNIGKRYSEKLVKLIIGMIEIEEDKRMDFLELEKYLENYVLE